MDGISICGGFALLSQQKSPYPEAVYISEAVPLSEGTRFIFDHPQYSVLIWCTIQANRKPDRKSASVRMKVGWFEKEKCRLKR